MDTEYIAPYSIRAGVEIIRHSPQLHNLLNFSPALPTLTFYGPPSPRFAMFCDTRIFTIRHIILVSKEHAKHNLKGFNVNYFLILLPDYGVYKTEINLPSKVTVSIVTRFVMPNRLRWKNRVFKKLLKSKKAIWSFNSWTLLSSSFLVLTFESMDKILNYDHYYYSSENYCVFYRCLLRCESSNFWIMN